MMKKSLCFLTLLMTLTGLSLTSCGNEVKNSNATSNNNDRDNLNLYPVEFDTTKDITITFYHTMNGTLEEVLSMYIDEFREIYPNIRVESVSAGGYDDVRDQMNTALASGSAQCDMVYCYPDHIATYNQSRSVVVLDNYINDEKYGMTKEQQDDFIDSYWEEGRSFGNNLMYSLPFSKSSEVLYYDKNEFAKLNLEVPTHWFKDDEGFTAETSVEYACEVLQQAHPKDIPLGYDSESNWFITLCEQYKSPYTSASADHYQFDNAINQGFVKRLKEWYNKGYFTTKAIYHQYTSNLFKNQDGGTRCYMCVGSSAGATNQVPDGFVFDVGVAPLPQHDANNPKVISQGPNVCIFKNEDSQKVMACWLLLKYLTTSIEFQVDFSMNSGYSPVFKSVYTNEVYAEFLDSADGGQNIAALSTRVARDEEDSYFTSPAFIGSSNARDKVGEMLVSIFTDTSSDLDGLINSAFKKAVNELKNNN